MVATLVLLVIGTLVIGAAVGLALRSLVLAEARTETHLHDPRTHTVAFAVPAGVDPAELRYRLHRSGFESALDRVGDDECLLVECEQEQRDLVRTAIRDAHLVGPDGTPLLLEHVVFEDERPAS